MDEELKVGFAQAAARPCLAADQPGGTNATVLRRAVLQRLGGALLCLGAGPALSASARAQREMQIHKVDALGLEIWVENQPPWQTQLMDGPSLPIFAAQSPANYHPPSVMTYTSVRHAAPPPEGFEAMAIGAVRRAAQNYRVPPAIRLSLMPRPASHGMLQGYEAVFEGMAQGDAVDVKVFIGQAPGKHPVAMQAYTLRGKMAHLDEPIRRAWGKLRYLG
jgi:hypothetical protein